jgi:hypothetical protein
MMSIGEVEIQCAVGWPHLTALGSNRCVGSGDPTPQKGFDYDSMKMLAREIDLAH